MDYAEFLASKRIRVQPSGFKMHGPVNPKLFPFQKDIVRWALRKGKCAIFADCGLGKTPCQLEWAYHVTQQTGKPVLIFAPLAVSQQTQREGVKFNVPVRICRGQADVHPGVNIANYEMLPHFTPESFSGLVCDESGILKGDGPMRRAITDFACRVPYRLACTATPAPNSFMELGNHAEFLGIMSKSEMLASFFIHDGGDTSKWRLKGHAETEFWKWMASWSVMIRKPSDLGYEDDGFTLPPLEYHQHTVKAEWTADYLFPVEATTMSERRGARRDSLDARVRLAAELVNASPDQWICWCGLNGESTALSKFIPTAVEVTGSDSRSHKEDIPQRFIAGDVKDVVSKADILGWGMNFQHCNHALACGLSDSWEALYQIVRRIWRFGQTKPCHFHIITGELEGAVVRNIERKERDAAAMAEGMLEHMREINTVEVHGTIQEKISYNAERKVVLPSWLTR